MLSITTAEPLSRQIQENEQRAKITLLRTDFDPVRQLCLVYRAEVSKPGQDYNFLTAFMTGLERFPGWCTRCVYHQAVLGLA